MCVRVGVDNRGQECLEKYQTWCGVKSASAIRSSPFLCWWFYEEDSEHISECMDMGSSTTTYLHCVLCWWVVGVAACTGDGVMGCHLWAWDGNVAGSG